MRPTTCWISFLFLVAALVPVRRVNACSCWPAHPQTAYCKSDFVAVVRVKQEHYVNETLQYKVKVNRIFAATMKADIALKRNILWTPRLSSACGVYLTRNETYVVGGRLLEGKPYFTSCSLSMRWSSVNKRQRKGFKWLYKKGCSCEIRYTSWRHKGAVLEEAGGKRCIWESMPGPQDCQEKYGVCMGGPGNCSWMHSLPYTNCIKEHRRQRG